MKQKIIAVIAILFLVGCGANCNTFIPKEELSHYYLLGALHGADCHEHSKPDDEMGTWYACVRNKFEKQYPDMIELHKGFCKYKIFAQ